MQKENLKKNIVLSKSFEFSKDILRFTDKLTEDKKYFIANQLAKSGTSIGANLNEAQNAESNADFIHKLKISIKEAEETDYWLKLISEVYTQYKLSKMISDLNEILKILNSSIATLKRREKSKTVQKYP